ncbi:hypothetical protein C8R47DRAFT_1132093 [Mycena vitilis]|nr:hypothetical protein C8R47DRAFT_1132093 [Mycena vitilis]
MASSSSTSPASSSSSPPSSTSEYTTPPALIYPPSSSASSWPSVLSEKQPSRQSRVIAHVQAATTAALQLQLLQEHKRKRDLLDTGNGQARGNFPEIMTDQLVREPSVAPSSFGPSGKLKAKPPESFRSGADLLSALAKTCLEDPEVDFSGSYLIATNDADTLSDKQRVQRVAHDIWKATGYRFTVKDHPPSENGHKTRLWCSQDEARRSKHRGTGDVPRVSRQGDALSKQRFPCRSRLMITCLADAGGGSVRVVTVRMHHHMRHDAYLEQPPTPVESFPPPPLMTAQFFNIVKPPVYRMDGLMQMPVEPPPMLDEQEGEGEWDVSSQSQSHSHPQAPEAPSPSPSPFAPSPSVAPSSIFAPSPSFAPAPLSSPMIATRHPHPSLHPPPPPSNSHPRQIELHPRPQAQPHPPPPPYARAEPRSQPHQHPHLHPHPPPPPQSARLQPQHPPPPPQSARLQSQSQTQRHPQALRQPRSQPQPQRQSPLSPPPNPPTNSHVNPAPPPPSSTVPTSTPAPAPPPPTTAAEFQHRMRAQIARIRDFCDGLEYQVQFGDVRMLEALERSLGAAPFVGMMEECLGEEGR